MRIEQAGAVELLRARMAIVGALLQRTPAFGPDWPHWYGGDAVNLCSAEAHLHLLQLATALRFGRRGMFVRHVQWLRLVLTHRGLSDKAILLSLRALVDILRECLAPQAAEQAIGYVRAAMDSYDAPGPAPSALGAPQRECVDALLADDPAAAQQLAATATHTGLDPVAYCVSVLAPAMHEVGRLWQVNAISVEQEHECTARAALVLAALVPPAPRPLESRRAACGCIAGERHDLGLRMVASVLRAHGWRVDCPDPHRDPSGLLREVIAVHARLVAISATMVQHLPAVQATIAAIRAMPECAGVQVLVGGQAFEHDAGVWKEVGADATAADAIEAIDAAGRLVPGA